MSPSAISHRTQRRLNRCLPRSLPGADRIAIKTGAHVIANGEAINDPRSAGVPEDQLIPVAGGERIPLFTLESRQAATRGEVDVTPGPPEAHLGMYDGIVQTVQPQPDRRTYSGNRWTWKLERKTVRWVCGAVCSEIVEASGAAEEGDLVYARGSANLTKAVRISTRYGSDGERDEF
jgi:hypothetical protein